MLHNDQRVGLRDSGGFQTIGKSYNDDGLHESFHKAGFETKIKGATTFEP